VVSFNFLWSDKADDAAIGDSLVGGDLVVINELAGLCAGGHSGADAIGQAAELVGKTMDPDVFVGPVERWQYSRDWPVTGLMTVLAMAQGVMDGRVALIG
jgi:hypothetical protein